MRGLRKAYFADAEAQGDEVGKYHIDAVLGMSLRAE